MGKYIVEISYPHKSFKEYKTVDQPVITIGRSYANDIILFDQYVCAEHVRISWDDDGWKVEDLGSKNGVFDYKNRKAVKEICLQSGQGVVLGKTRIRIFNSDHPIKPTLSLIHTNPVYKILSHPISMLCIGFFTLFLYGYEAYLTSSENLAIGKLISSSFGIFVAALIWAGVWAFVGRLIKNRSRFFLQMTVSFIFFLMLIPLGNISSYAGYITSSLMVEGVIMSILFCLMFSVLLARTLAIATNTSRKQQYLISGGISLLMIGAVVIFYFAFKDEFTQQAQYYSNVKPPFAKLRSGSSVDAFLAESEHIFTFKNK